MANEGDRLSSGSGGNTAGTGGPGESGSREGVGAGAAGFETQQGGSDGARTTAERLGGDDLAQASPELRQAIEGGANAAGPGARGGKMSTEGTGNAGGAPDPGDPGGMGGAGAAPLSHDNRPPGGVSPLGSGHDD